jgi:hypothetical protein
MKKIIYLFAISIFFASCSSEIISEESTGNETTTLFNKSAFDAGDVYQNILNDHKNGLDIFYALSNVEKQEVWAYKFDKYRDINTLNSNQNQALEVLEAYFSELDWDSTYDEAGMIYVENILLESFTAIQRDQLMLTLSNDPIGLPQTSGGSQTEGCFGCWQVISGSESGCHAELNSDGNPTGDFFFTATVRRSYGFFRAGASASAILSCSEADWDGSFQQHPW